MFTDNILVLGRGYIGTYLSDYLSTKYNVLTKSSKELNYHDKNVLRKFLEDNRIKLVINCSGFTGRPNVDEAESKKEECYQLNVVCPLSVATTCNTLGVRCFHMSSGCIYSGYEKDFKEKDAPNFGMFNESSFYSKTKHSFEMLSRDLNVSILRLRMPICENVDNPRNYLYKIMRYPNLVDIRNSKTFLRDLAGFTEALFSCRSEMLKLNQQIYNVVNPKPLTTKEVIEELNGLGFNLNPNWVNQDELKLAAPRSNCILDNSKVMEIYKFRDEKEIYLEV